MEKKKTQRKIMVTDRWICLFDVLSGSSDMFLFLCLYRKLETKIKWKWKIQQKHNLKCQQKTKPTNETQHTGKRKLNWVPLWLFFLLFFFFFENNMESVLFEMKTVNKGKRPTINQNRKQNILTYRICVCVIWVMRTWTSLISITKGVSYLGRAHFSRWYTHFLMVSQLHWIDDLVVVTAYPSYQLLILSVFT